MSENSSAQKTEQPTEKKLKDARNDGQVAQTKDLNFFIALLTIIGLIIINKQYFVSILENNYIENLSLISLNRLGTSEIISIAFSDIVNVIKFIILIIGIAAICSFLMNLTQIGGLIISKKAFNFNFNKLNPVSNAKQIFSLKNLIKFFKNIFEIVIMLVCGIIIIKNSINSFVLLNRFSLPSIIGFISFTFLKVFFTLLVVYFIFAIFDYLMERRALRKQLMMTKDEVFREYKETNGDPQIKHRRKELHQEVVEEDGVFDTIKQSSMILANPTHFAIVILYSPKRWKLPIILAKAKNNHAQMIFRIAEKLNVPIFRDKWLTRRLYELGKVGEYVPSSLIADVADLIGKNLSKLPQVYKELQEIKTVKENNTYLNTNRI